MIGRLLSQACSITASRLSRTFMSGIRSSTVLLPFLALRCIARDGGIGKSGWWHGSDFPFAGAEDEIAGIEGGADDDGFHARNVREKVEVAPILDAAGGDDGEAARHDLREIVHVRA